MVNVTAADVSAGRIRVTQEPKKALALPRDRTRMSVSLRGEPVAATWDPRIGPDRERSGVLNVSRADLARLLGGPAVLEIGWGPEGGLILR
jgi:hypothetical protein